MEVIRGNLPPIDPGNIRVILTVEDIEHPMLIDLSLARLSKWFKDLNDMAKAIGRKPLVKRTREGGQTAREIFRGTVYPVEAEEYAVGGIAALWICLHSEGLPPGYGLSMTDLRKAAGSGTIRIFVNRDHTEWVFDLEDAEAGRRVGGRRSTPVLH